MANEVDFRPLKYLCNGTTRDFPFEWKILSVDEVVVILETIATGEQTTLQFPNDYSVTFESTGGQVTTKTAYASEYDIIISRQSSLYQKKRYSTSTGFQASEVEKSFDEVSMNLQEQAYTLERAIKVPVGSSVLNLNLPLPNAGKTLKWNEEETGLVNSTIDVDELESYAERLYESADNIDIVADNILDVNDVADIMDDVTTVADIEGEVVDVAGIKDNIVAVDNNKNNINAVVLNESNINNVAGNRENINKVADIDDEVVAVAEIDDEVITVAEIDDEVVAVAHNETNINNCSNNMSSILDAPNQAQTATQQAGIATDKAEETALALAEARRMKDSIAYFEYIKAGNLDDVRDVYLVAGNLDDVRTDYIVGGTLDDIRISPDELRNLNKLPLLKTQVVNNENTLNETITRVAKNESDIKDLQDKDDSIDVILDTINGDIEQINTDIEGIELDIDELGDGLTSAEGRIGKNESDIDVLQFKTDLFNIIEGGSLDDVRIVYNVAGNLDTSRTDYIVAGNLDSISVSKEDLRNATIIPFLKNQVEELTEKLNYALNYIASIQSGIVVGSLDR